ncbi:MAG: lyase family protein [Georgenia sp.]
MFDGGLFGPAPAVPAAPGRTGDAAVIAAMVRAEVALLHALQSCGLVPDGADGGPAGDLERAAAGRTVDPAERGVRARGAGNPVVPLVQDLLAAVPERARPWVHLGATSQDIVDTALVLVARAAVRAAVAHLRRARAAAVALAHEHRTTAMVGRTLGQAAVPTTFGLKAAGWAVGLAAATDELERVVDRLAVQLAGAAGTLAVYGAAGPRVLDAFARELDLPAPRAPWHTERSWVRELAAALAAVAAAGKVATDVSLLATTEVGEVVEGGGAGHGGSSAMPHKRNPVTSVLVRAAATRTPGLVGTVLAANLHEHERATGAWHAEWQPLVELMMLAEGATERVADLLDGLDVQVDRMRTNLDAARPFVMAETLATRLAVDLGRARAQDVVRVAFEESVARHGPHPTDDQLRTALAEGTGHLGAPGPGPADLDPAAALGAVDGLIDRALPGLD